MNKIILVILGLALSSTLLSAQENTMKKAYFAGGCFWGVEYHLEKLDGVKDVVSGFMGGHKQNPSYQDVSYTDTGHVETVEVVYDPTKISYETIAKNFFEIHDFTQKNGQGPDIGSQYLSVIFYSDEAEKKTAQQLIAILSKKGAKNAMESEGKVIISRE